MNDQYENSASQIQGDIDVRRKRIEDKIDAIQQRVSPGQLIDEVLTYAKESGGSEYVSNLGTALKSNPLPVALMGVSLVWLISKQGAVSTTETNASTRMERDEYPLYVARGSVRRVGQPEEVDGRRYSHFTDDGGQRFKALTDEAGRRAGNFLDDSGKAYRGFVDASGKHIANITDEAGQLLDASTGWIADTWKQLGDKAGDIGQRVSDSAESLLSAPSSLGSKAVAQSSRLNQAILMNFRDQPLVGGALAFAVGAAIGAVLPHTDKEDEILGDAADTVKDSVSSQASDLMEHGKELATDTLDKGLQIASEMHDSAKEKLVAGLSDLQRGGSATKPL